MSFPAATDTELSALTTQLQTPDFSSAPSFVAGTTDPVSQPTISTLTANLASISSSTTSPLLIISPNDSTDESENNTRIISYYIIFVVIFGFFFTFAIWLMLRRRKRMKAQQQRRYSQNALARDVEGWTVHPRRLWAIHGRWHGGSQTRMRRVILPGEDEGLDECGEAPPPYQPPAPLSPAVIVEISRSEDTRQPSPPVMDSEGIMRPEHSFNGYLPGVSQPPEYADAVGLSTPPMIETRSQSRSSFITLWPGGSV